MVDKFLSDYIYFFASYCYNIKENINKISLFQQILI